VFWTITQPVNRRWSADVPLTGTARRFFSAGKKAHGTIDVNQQDQWESLRDRWEYSHIVRAIFAAISLISITIAIALYRHR